MVAFVFITRSFKALLCSLFGATYTKIGTIQRRLAWPLRKDDTQNREAFHIFWRQQHQIIDVGILIRHCFACLIIKISIILLHNLIKEREFAGSIPHTFCLDKSR